MIFKIPEGKYYLFLQNDVGKFEDGLHQIKMEHFLVYFFVLGSNLDTGHLSPPTTIY